MSIVERIYQLIEKQGISVNKFSKEIGVSNAYFAKMRASNGQVGSGVVEKIVNVYGVNPSWLVMGQGSMYNDRIVSEPDVTYGLKKGIPLVEIEAQAGWWNQSFCIDEKEVIERYVIPDLKDADFLIRVNGQSMLPTMMPGDIAACRIIRDAAFVQWGRIHLIGSDTQGLIIKRLHPGADASIYRCASDNDDYQDFNLPLSDINGIALIIGIVRIE
jgi:repressor LexA